MNEQHYAVVVGINRYPEFRRLNYARNDAEAFYAWLIDPEGGAVPEKNIAKIMVPDEAMPEGTPRREARPVKEEIEDALDEFRLRSEQHVAENPADWHQTRLYFFASGHGIAPAPNEAALLMADAGPNHYGKNFSCAKYLEFFQKGQFFKELIFFADCCRERVGNAPIYGPTWTEVSNQNGQLLTVRGFATYFGELAFEEEAEENVEPDELRGYFSKALLEGLRGQAADPTTHQIDSDTLAKYVTERVKTLTAHRRKPQTPFFASEPTTPRIVFRRNVPKQEIKESQTHPVRLFFPAGFAGKVKLVVGQATKEYEVGPSPWVVPLTNGAYRVKPEDGSNPFQGGGYFEVIGEAIDVKL
jgi:uncharacterized caspase-like protein